MSNDDEFFSILYQQWAMTTGAKNHYYGVADRGDTCDEAVRYQVYAAETESGGQRYIAGFYSEADADFFAGMHGALPDLIRRLHDLNDEAESKDAARDRAEALNADLALENMGLAERIRELERKLD